MHSPLISRPWAPARSPFFGPGLIGQPLHGSAPRLWRWHVRGATGHANEPDGPATVPRNMKSHTSEPCKPGLGGEAVYPATSAFDLSDPCQPAIAGDSLWRLWRACAIARAGGQVGWQRGAGVVQVSIAHARVGDVQMAIARGSPGNQRSWLGVVVLRPSCIPWGVVVV